MLEQAQRETREKEEAVSRLRQDPEPLHRDKLGGAGTLRSQMSISDIERVPEHNPRHDELDYAGITETNIEQLGMAAYYKATGRGQPPRRVLKAEYAEGWRTWVREQIEQLGAHRFGHEQGQSSGAAYSNSPPQYISRASRNRLGWMWGHRTEPEC